MAPFCKDEEKYKVIEEVTTKINQIKNDGFQVLDEWEMDDNSLELTVTRWIT